MWPLKVPESIFTVISQMTKFLTLYLPMESGGDSYYITFPGQEVAVCISINHSFF